MSSEWQGWGKKHVWASQITRYWRQNARRHMVPLTRKLHTDRPPLTHEFLISRFLSSPSLWGREMGTNGSCLPSPACSHRVSLSRSCATAPLPSPQRKSRSTMRGRRRCARKPLRGRRPPVWGPLNVRKMMTSSYVLVLQPIAATGGRPRHTG